MAANSSLTRQCQNPISGDSAFELRITDAHGPRFDLALERLSAGHSFTFRDVRFWLSPVGELEVNAYSSWAPQNVTPERAMEDVRRAQLVYKYLCGSPAFVTAVQHSAPQFFLIYDYGGGEVELGRLVDGQIAWAKGFNPFGHVRK